MKIAITSDSHDNWINLEKAVKAASNNKCEQLLFAGDLIAPPGIAVLEKFEGRVKFIWGNNEGERMGLTRKADASQKIDLVIHGHNHDEKREIKVGKTLLVNPGGLQLYPGSTPSITIYDTQQSTVESVEI